MIKNFIFHGEKLNRRISMLKNVIIDHDNLVISVYNLLQKVNQSVSHIKNLTVSKKNIADFALANSIV